MTRSTSQRPREPPRQHRRVPDDRLGDQLCVDVADRVGHSNPGDGMTDVIQDRGGHARQTCGHLTVLHGETLSARLPQQRLESARRGGADSGAVDEGSAIGVGRGDLRRGQVGQQRPPARGQVRGKPDTDVGHQRRSAERALLEDVQDVAPVQDREVGTVTGLVDELRQRTACDALQGLLPAVAAPDLEGSNPQTVATVLGEVDDEPFSDHDVHQVVRAAPGKVTGTDDRAEGDRVGLTSEVLQDSQRPHGGWNLRHRSPERLRYETSLGARRFCDVRCAR